MLLAQFLSVAFFGIACVTTGIIPGLMAVGLIGGNQTYIDWANDIAASKGWQFALGSLVIVIASLMFVGGWRWTLRMQNGIFLFTLAGIVVATLIALFTSRSGFISDFNSFAQPTTGSSDSFHDVISTAQKAGVDTSPGFSLSNTWPVVGVLAGFSIYTYFSSFIGGELRSARSMGTANRMALAGILNIIGVVVCVIVFLHTMGTAFVTAGFGGGMPAELVAPYYFFVAPMIVNSQLAGRHPRAQLLPVLAADHLHGVPAADADAVRLRVRRPAALRRRIHVVARARAVRRRAGVGDRLAC